MDVLRDSPWVPLPPNDKISDTIHNDDAEKRILNEIINILSLDGDDEQKNKIMNDLIVKGRESLVKYRYHILPKAYDEAMSENDSILMILMKKFFELKMKTKYGGTTPWFISFLKEYKGENCDIYDRVLTRTADYGLRYMKNCPQLSIVLQLLFESIDDACLKPGNVFDQLWFSITNDGIKSITKFSDYIIKGVMNKQLNKESTLFQALREYHRESILSILKECSIVDKGNLYGLVLDDVVINGWLADMKSVEEYLTPMAHRMLLAKLQSFREDNFIWPRIRCDGCHIVPIIGKRYYCTTCGNYDLCNYCQAIGHPHKLMQVPIPQSDKNNDNAGKNNVENDANNMEENNKKQDIDDREVKKEITEKSCSEEDGTNVQTSKKSDNQEGNTTIPNTAKPDYEKNKITLKTDETSCSEEDATAVQKREESENKKDETTTEIAERADREKSSIIVQNDEEPDTEAGNIITHSSHQSSIEEYDILVRNLDKSDKETDHITVQSGEKSDTEEDVSVVRNFEKSDRDNDGIIVKSSENSSSEEDVSVVRNFEKSDGDNDDTIVNSSENSSSEEDDSIVRNFEKSDRDNDDIIVKSSENSGSEKDDIDVQNFEKLDMETDRITVQSSEKSDSDEEDTKGNDNEKQAENLQNSKHEDSEKGSDSKRERKQEVNELSWDKEEAEVLEYDQQEENAKLDIWKDDNKNQCSGKDCHEIKDEQKDDSEQIKSTATWKGRAGFTAIQNVCQQEALQLHNRYRAQHGVPPLVLDDAISRKAQHHADYLVITSQLRHSVDLAGLGENLYTVSNCELDEPTGFGTKATESWYSEIKNYDFQRPSFSASTAHFSQLIWKNTKKLGIGIGFADGGRKATVVARYELADNVKEDFQHNVSGPIHS